MKQRRTIGRLGDYAEEVAAAVRVGHGEARVLTDESPEGVRLQSLCQAIVDEEGSTAVRG